ncbi:MAG TPA: ribose-5-phosphate isomerase RpiA [Gammaproteobacteria bacterium]|jgi:ribose 5-phosphate isomerase A|nr:ribose-5-phosphate isomerase RpiA [Gammaproteobacteria bacterium]HIM21520.1 ribose-5-phosphate isomerase RpiA [Gammaproteobacteria bacterium]HIN74496.1 ribose-5-phosphate isomerase RpiA [Gammaproteobacteria bacterium]|tara:strand:+ start:45 stop:713 length:669 start_codon:yes stop_codon:yes gene_type:complete
MDKERKKKLSAEKAYEIIKKDLNRDTVLGIGTGTTTNCFIEIIKNEKLDVKGAVCSSESSKEFLSSSNIKILSLNDVHQIDFYIDGADEFNSRRELIKGGGGALTKEKILAHSSETFICIVDDSKYSDLLGKFPIPIEVIELARSAISREMMRMGGRPVYRNNFVTDNGNQIIDVHHLDLKIPYETEQLINNIPGVVENGIFSSRKADIILQSSDDGVEVIN